MENNNSSDSIVISGVDGRFPKSKNMEELAFNLYNKIDFGTEEEIRWSHADYPNLPKRVYLIDDLEKFDAALFKVFSKQADVMDPQGRILLELAYSAILDAGIHPSTLRGSNTAVFVGSCYNDAMMGVFNDPTPTDGYTLTGCNPVFLSNRISYALDLKGPSFTLDSACSSATYAMLMAVNAMRLNQCDAALVCGSNLILNPNLSVHEQKLGVLSPDGYSYTFDSKGNGFVRAETISVLFLQRRKDAKRVYADIVHILGNNDGYKTVGISCPSGIVQSELFMKMYNEANVDPLNVNYVEAHVSGTVAGDIEECFAIDTTFCKNRTKPLLVGGIKSNMGHGEGASGLCSIAKVIHSFETGIIPATLHVENVRTDIPSLTEGRLRVCTEATPLPGALVAVNSFGFGGANVHLLLKQWNKTKDHIQRDQIPRLVIWSGRTEEAVSTIINKVKSIPIDPEFIGLLHNTQKVQIPENLYRGFGVFEDKGVNQLPVCLSEKCDCLEDTTRPVVWLFTGLGCQWIGMGKSLMQIQPFYESILKCHNILEKFSVDLITIITTDNDRIFDKILTSFVGITCIQIALVDVLRTLEIPVDFIIGHSNGELASAYADGAITLEQAVLTAYIKGKVSIEEETIDGLMAAVGLGYNQIKNRLPPNVYVGCRNSAESCTISGPRDDVLQFIEKLKSEKVFARDVNTSRIAYHSKYIADMMPKVLKNLHKIMPNRTLRSPKWISTSIPFEQWSSDLGKYSSAEYHVNSMISPVLFEDACSHLPSNSIIIEVAPHALLQPIMKRSFPNAINVPLTQRNHQNNAAFFLESLGKLFVNGVPMQVDQLYPPIEFPVSRGTPMIAPLIKYDHDQNWSVPKLHAVKNNSFERKVTIDISQEEYEYLTGHALDSINRAVISGSTYCYLVWETLAMLSSEPDVSAFNVELTNIVLHRTTSLSPDIPVHLFILIHTSGNFEITEGRTPIITGIIKHTPNEEPKTKPLIESNDENSIILRKKEIYREMQLRGFRYSNVFRALNSFCCDNNSGTVQWNGHWDAFMDAMTHVYPMSRQSRAMHLPTSIRKIKINAIQHSNWVASVSGRKKKYCNVSYCKESNTIVAGGIEISGLETVALDRSKSSDTEVLENYQFVPLIDDRTTYSLTDAARISVQLAIEKLSPNHLTIIEALDDNNDPVIEYFRDVMFVTPRVNATFTLLTDRNFEMDSIETKSTAIDQTKGTILIWNAISNDVSSVVKRLSPHGFLIIIRDNRETLSYKAPADFTLVSLVQCASVSLFIYQHDSNSLAAEHKVIAIGSDDREFFWLNLAQEAQKTENVILLSQRDKTSGLLGLLKTARIEPNTANYKCVIIDDDDAPPFDITSPFYSQQLKLGLPFNILRNGKWGTYRHLLLKREDIEAKSSSSLCIQAGHLGNLQSLEWVAYTNSDSDGELVDVHYVGLTQRDWMLATGKLTQDAYVDGIVKQVGLFGREFSGVTANGQRVMGMKVEDGSLPTQDLCSSEDFIFMIPNSITLQEAATIPAAYLTVYSAFFIGNQISAGQTILIHDDYNYMSLAAIQIALFYGLDVYSTSVSSDQKGLLLYRHRILNGHKMDISSNQSSASTLIENSKDFSVDIVLSFKPEDEIQASIRYLRSGGTLIAIEPSNIEKVLHLSEPLLKMGIVFKTILLDKIAKNASIRHRLIEICNKDLKRGAIKPLPLNIFHSNQIELAFQTMSTEKHHAKTVIAMPNQKERANLKIKPKFMANSKSVYIVVGGLGELGLELVNWLVLRGAKNLVLCSRRGPTSAYQHYRIRFWESLGCKIIISTRDITTFDGCESLLKESHSYGPILGIFNLAGVLFDHLFTHQTADQFMQSFAPKAYATKYLDELSRNLCPELEQFVVFSSIASGRGNMGQSNYAMANSIMDRIIENRVQHQYPGKSIQWGPISDVGMIARVTNNDNSTIFSGLSQQRVDRCIHLLDDLLFAKCPIVSSIQVPHDYIIDESNLFSHLLQIFGVKDVSKVRMNATLTDLGLDSLLISEAKQILERDANVVLSSSELKNITVEELKKITGVS